MPGDSDVLCSLGPFDVHEELARGGMGVVLRATHRAEAVPVAVKVVVDPAGQHESYADDFRAEVRSVAQLNHPHIVPLLDYGTIAAAEAERSAGELVAGSPFLAMELADSGDLSAGVRDWPTLRRLLSELLDALAHAHASGVVHRDLKPGNVLLHRGSRSEPQVLLADFGIAHASDHRADGQTELTEMTGTPSYMAPEQVECRWRDFGPWTDLYALGIMSYQLVAGAVPFKAEVAVAVLLMHLTEALPELRPLYSVPPALAGWIGRLTEKKHEARFTCAADAARALASLDASYALSDPGPAKPAEESPWVDAPPWAAAAEDAAPAAPPWASPNESAPAAAPPWASAPKESAPAAAPPWAAPAPTHDPLATHKGGKAPQGAAAPAESGGVPATDGRAPVPESWEREGGEAPPLLHGAGLGLYHLRAIPVVDRAEGRRAAWGALQECARDGRPRAIVLQGASGTGKSRLAQWLGERAHETGAAEVLRAEHAPELGPMHGLPRMVAAHYRAVGLEGGELRTRLVECLLRERGEALEAEVLLELLTPGQGVGVRFGSPAERWLAVEGVIARAAAERAVIVWIDDAQWGPDSIGMVEHALESLDAPALFVLTVREEELTERTREAEQLARLVEHDRAHLERVPPLLREDTVALVEQLLGLSGELATRVVDRVDGNPLFAVQLVGDWVERGVLELTSGGFALKPGERGELPDDIHAVWAERIQRSLGGLDAAERELVELAAVLGLSHDEDEVDAVCRAHGAELSEELLETLARAHLIDRGDAGWSFVHGMLRESLIREAESAGRAPEMHRLCARIIGERGGVGSATRRAHHLAEAGELEAALEPYLEAARELRDRSEYAAALAALSRRDDLIGRLGLPEDDRRWGEGWALRADVHRLDWDFDAAATWAETARSAADSLGWETIGAEARLLLANVARQRGETDVAFVRARKSYASFGALGHDSGSARALLVMGAISRQRGEYDRAAALYARAFASFEIVEDERGAANAMLGLAHLARHRKDFRDAREKYEAARLRCERAGYRAGIANCLMGRADVQRYEGDRAGAEEAYRAAHRIQSSIGSKAVLIARLNLGLVLLEQERFEEARAVFEREVPGLERDGKRAYLGWVRSVLLPCCAHAGDLKAFDQNLEVARAVTEDRGMVDEDMAAAAERAAELLAESGAEDRARAALELAHAQWVALKDDERAAAVASRLG